MANEKNLENGAPHRFRTGEQQVKTATKAGQASGAARRAKRDLRKVMQDFLARPNTMPQTRAALQQLGYDPETITNLEGMLVGLYKAAMKGNPQAIAMAMQYAGMDPAQIQKDKESKARTAKLKAETEAIQRESEDGSGEGVTVIIDV